MSLGQVLSPTCDNNILAISLAHAGRKIVGALLLSTIISKPYLPDLLYTVDIAVIWCMSTNFFKAKMASNYPEQDRYVPVALPGYGAFEERTSYVCHV
jgi:hypothetical protein